MLVSAPVILPLLPILLLHCTKFFEEFQGIQGITLKWSAKNQGHFGAVQIIIATVTVTLFC